MPAKYIYLPEDLSSLLKQEANVSGLIQKLLREYFGSSNPKERAKMELSKLKKERKRILLALKSSEKEQLKQEDLEKIKEKGHISEAEIQMWEERWRP